MVLFHPPPEADLCKPAVVTQKPGRLASIKAPCAYLGNLLNRGDGDEHATEEQCHRYIQDGSATAGSHLLTDPNLFDRSLFLYNTPPDLERRRLLITKSMTAGRTKAFYKRPGGGGGEEKEKARSVLTTFDENKIIHQCRIYHFWSPREPTSARRNGTIATGHNPGHRYGNAF